MLGIGAGWLRNDYRVAGIEQADARTRIARLAEAVQICRGAWTGEPFSFDGEHYRISEFTAGTRKPVSSIPVLIGGGKEILSLAARKADIVGVNPRRSWPGTSTPGLWRRPLPMRSTERIGWIRAAAATRIEDIELQLQCLSPW